MVVFKEKPTVVKLSKLEDLLRYIKLGNTLEAYKLISLYPDLVNQRDQVCLPKFKTLYR